MILAILVCLYMITGYSTAQALSVVYSQKQWWRSWTCVLLWPLFVLWSGVGLIVELITWIHGQMFPKE